MFPRYGMTPLQLFNYRRTYLTDSATISIYSGVDGRGGDQFTALPNQPTPCKLIETSGFSATPDGYTQAFSAKAIVGGEIALQEPGKRYQIKIDVFAPGTDTAGNQVVLRTRLFEVLGVESPRDSVGGEGLQVVKLKSA